MGPEGTDNIAELPNLVVLLRLEAQTGTWQYLRI